MSSRVAFVQLAAEAIDEFPVENEFLQVTEPELRSDDESPEDFLFGEFDYESEALFGSPTEASGPYVYHAPTRLFGFVSEAGSFEMSRGPIVELEELCEVAGLPEITPEDGHRLYRELGTGPYSVRFSRELRTYDRDTRNGGGFDPEREAELRSQESAGISVSEEYMKGLVDDAIDDRGLYVSSATVSIDGESIGYGSPLCFLTDEVSRDRLMEITRVVVGYFTNHDE